MRSVNESWHDYLRQGNTKESNLGPAQRDEMKRSFYAGFYYCTAHYEQVANMPPEKFKAWMEFTQKEVNIFFESEFVKMQKDVTLLKILKVTDHPDRLLAIVEQEESIQRLIDTGLLVRDDITNNISVTPAGHELINRHAKFKG